MAKRYRIIGNMTGNSMDALDFVFTEFRGSKIHDLCAYSRPFSPRMQQKMDALRRMVYDRTAVEIENMLFFHEVHDEYVREVASCIDEMCRINKLDKSKIDAIAFHGKTLDHNPPSRAHINANLPYTLQIGSGSMLADLTDIKVVYDFRSDLVMNGFDGAPLAGPHNAHIARSEGDGIYYNGGNTGNFALVHNRVAIIGSDSGPFNEYVDGWVRSHTPYSFDKDGNLGREGKIINKLLEFAFEQGRDFYEAPLPKSGDPAYYHTKEVFAFAEENGISFADALRTFEYFAAYIAVYTLSKLNNALKMPKQIMLFGGGWHNPIIREDFEKLLHGEGVVLSEHKRRINRLAQRMPSRLKIRYSSFGDYMESRLFADMARYYLAGQTWELPELISTQKEIVCGRLAVPQKDRGAYFDKVNRAAKGWQYH